VLVNICTTEVHRVLEPIPVEATLTSIDSLVRQLRKTAPVLLDDAALNEVLAYTCRLMQDNMHRNFAAVMSQLESIWTRAFNGSHTLYVACDPVMVKRLLA